LRAADSAIATAWRCGRPERTNSLMFALTVFLSLPFRSGM
jgi:hypothetical protein